MKFKKGKFFYFFFPENSPYIIKFKSKDKKFFSANTIFKYNILSTNLYDIKIDEEVFSFNNILYYNLPFEISFFKTLYYRGESIEINIKNKEKNNLSINIIVFDENMNLRFFGEYTLESFLKIKFNLFGEGKHRVLFFINNNYYFFFNIQIIERGNNKIDILKKGKEVIEFNILNDNRLYKEIIFYSIIDANTSLFYQQLIEENITIKREELYIPINIILGDDDNFLRYLNINKNTFYNPKGLYKIVQTIKYMKESEQIKFIESLFKTDIELADLILYNIFNFYLLFILNNEEKREILRIIDDDTLIYAFKRDEKDYKNLKDFLPVKRRKYIEKRLKELTFVKSEEIEESHRSIGDIIRAYFQVKYGKPFIIQENKEVRFKEQIFNNIIVYGKNSYKISLPHFLFNGDYKILFYGKKDNRILSELSIKVTSKKEIVSFNLFKIFENKDFYRIARVDKEYIYIKFSEYIEKVQFSLINKHNSIKVYEFNKIKNDELIRIPYFSNDKITVYVGAIAPPENENIYEASFLLEVYDYIPYTVSNIEEKQVVKISSNDKKEWLLEYEKDINKRLQILFKNEHIDIFDIILEIKIFNYLYKNLKNSIYCTIRDMLIEILEYKFYNNNLFKFSRDEKESDKISIEVLFFLRDIYEDNIENLNKLIDNTLDYFYKNKIKDNRLGIYRKKLFSDSAGKYKKYIKNTYSPEDKIYKYIMRFL